MSAKSDKKSRYLLKYSGMDELCKKGLVFRSLYYGAVLRFCMIQYGTWSTARNLFWGGVKF